MFSSLKKCVLEFRQRSVPSRGIVRDSPTVVFSFENEYFFNRCCLSSSLKNIDEIQTTVTRNLE